MSDVPKNAKKPEDHRASVKGKVFTYTDDDGNTLTIPLRLKMKVLLELAEVNLDAPGMYRMIQAIAPDQVATVEEMDANDFAAAFLAWQEAYNEASGASLGEAERSPS